VLATHHMLPSPGCGGQRRGSSLQSADATTTNMYLRGGGGGDVAAEVDNRNTESTVRGMRGSTSWRRCQNGKPAAGRERACAGCARSDPGDKEPGARGRLGTRIFPR
jgi:hypothetical protein